MQAFCHQGFAVSASHPAAWIDRGEQIVRDLVEVFAHPDITPGCLQHLIAHRERLIAGRYQEPGRLGCLMFVLTEPLGERQIRSKRDLVRFFGRERGFFGWFGHVAAKDSPEYQPAKWIVRLIDGQFCDKLRARYGRACEFFDYDLVIGVARQVLAQREIVERTLPLAMAAAR
jgi:hypothetical protein